MTLHNQTDEEKISKDRHKYTYTGRVVKTAGTNSYKKAKYLAQVGSQYINILNQPYGCKLK